MMSKQVVKLAPRGSEVFRLLVLAAAFSGCSGDVTSETVNKQGLADSSSPAFSSLNLQLAVSKNACAGNVAQDYFNLKNADTASVPLSSLSVKYWVNDTSGVPIAPHVWYGGCVTSSNGTCVHQVTGVTATATPFAACSADPSQQANWEITVTTTDATLLKPGFTWSGVQTAINRSDNQPFVPGSATWYSGCGVGQPYAPDPHFGAYVSGTPVFSNGIAAPSCRAPHGSQQLSGYFGVPPNPAVAPLAGPVDPSTVVSIDVGLPMRDPVGLQQFIDDVGDYRSPNYRVYKSVADFASRWGADPNVYSMLTGWAQTAGFTVVRSYPNNLLITLSATAATIERALFANLVYRLRADGTKFVAVDRDPSLNFGSTILRISGLSDYFPVTAKAVNGTSNGQNYWGEDLRNAYLGVGSPCLGLTGQGETVGILDVGSFDTNDLKDYDGDLFPPRPAGDVTVVTLDSGSGSNSDQTEVALDVDQVNAMAPAAKIIVFHGTTGITSHADSILHAMATDGRLTIASNSFSFGWNENAEQAVSELAAEGVTEFDASGDQGNVEDSADHSPEFQNQTLVGGTFLATKSLVVGPPNPVYPNPYYDSETVFPGSGGGILSGNDKDCWPWPFCDSAPRGIPGYQAGVDMSTNGGSTQFRNSPDVAAIAGSVGFVQGGNVQNTGGTSAAAPLWAGFIALANEQSRKNNLGRVGFANPVLYAIGLTASQPQPNAYSLAFNDIADGGRNNNFSAVTGYDLVTGWGTPKCGLITQLANNSPVTPASFAEIQAVIGNGDDGLRDNSSATLDVLAPDGSLIKTFTLKAQDAPGWDGKGLMHNPFFAFDAPISADSIGSVKLNLQEHFSFPDGPDNWSIDLLEIRAINPTGAAHCLVDQSGNAPLVRLTSDNSSATLTAGAGCSALVTPPPPTPNIEFAIQTGDDGLRDDSEGQATVFFVDGTSQLIELKSQGDGSWNDKFTGHIVTATLNSAAAIDHVVVNLVEHSSGTEGDDNWNVEGINITTFNPGGGVFCQADGNGDPFVRLTGSSQSVTIQAREGCP